MFYSPKNNAKFKLKYCIAKVGIFFENMENKMDSEWIES